MRTTVLVIAGALSACTVFAQQANFVNARVVARAAQPDVARATAGIAKAQTDPAWIGYAVPVIDNDSSGRNDGWSERCRLEQQPVDPPTNIAVRGPVRLEPSPTLMVLVRVQGGEIRRVRSLSVAARWMRGPELFWFGDVSGAQSVEFLKTLISDVDTRERSEAALSACPASRTPPASAILDLARNSTPRCVNARCSGSRGGQNRRRPSLRRQSQRPRCEVRNKPCSR